MANELTLTVSLSFSKNGSTEAFSKSGALISVSGDRYIRTVQAIGTAEEALNKAELGTLGYAICRNLDATNFITVRAATGLGTGIKLKPGEYCLFRCGGSAPYAIADTAPALLEYMLVED
jgi:hypothetical protein